MLHLASRTDPAWVERMLADLDTILIDHAHCEKKAASTAIGLIFRYAGHPSLMVPLSRLAREEMAHFEEVLRQIRRRGSEYRRLEPSPYAARLMEAVRRHEPFRCIDTLLCCALIEARSCERMQLLAEHLPEAELRALYAGLLESEARHHASFVDLARGLGVVPEAELMARLDELAEHEAQVIADAPDVPRLHN